MQHLQLLFLTNNKVKPVGVGLHTVQLFNLWPNTLFCKHAYTSILQIQMHPRTAADMPYVNKILTETKPFKLIPINDTLTHNPHKEFISAIQIMYLHPLSVPEISRCTPELLQMPCQRVTDGKKDDQCSPNDKGKLLQTVQRLA